MGSSKWKTTDGLKTGILQNDSPKDACLCSVFLLGGCFFWLGFFFFGGGGCGCGGFFCLFFV